MTEPKSDPVEFVTFLASANSDVRPSYASFHWFAKSVNSAILVFNSAFSNSKLATFLDDSATVPNNSSRSDFKAVCDSSADVWSVCALERAAAASANSAACAALNASISVALVDSILSNSDSFASNAVFVSLHTLSDSVNSVFLSCRSVSFACNCIRGSLLSVVAVACFCN